MGLSFWSVGAVFRVWGLWFRVYGLASRRNLAGEFRRFRGYAVSPDPVQKLEDTRAHYLLSQRLSCFLGFRDEQTLNPKPQKRSEARETFGCYACKIRA